MRHFAFIIVLSHLDLSTLLTALRCISSLCVYFTLSLHYAITTLLFFHVAFCYVSHNMLCYVMPLCMLTFTLLWSLFFRWVYVVYFSLTAMIAFCTSSLLLICCGVQHLDFVAFKSDFNYVEILYCTSSYYVNSIQVLIWQFVRDSISYVNMIWVCNILGFSRLNCNECVVAVIFVCALIIFSFCYVFVCGISFCVIHGIKLCPLIINSWSQVRTHAHYVSLLTSPHFAPLLYVFAYVNSFRALCYFLSFFALHFFKVYLHI